MKQSNKAFALEAFVCVCVFGLLTRSTLTSHIINKQHYDAMMMMVVRSALL